MSLVIANGQPAKELMFTVCMLHVHLEHQAQVRF
jgi:hypothetical protein